MSTGEIKRSISGGWVGFEIVSVSPSRVKLDQVRPCEASLREIAPTFHVGNQWETQSQFYYGI